MSLTGFLKGLRSLGAEAARHTIEPAVYTMGMSAYALGVRAAALSNGKAAKMTRGHADIWSLLTERIRRDEKYVWIHAASLGEFEQGRPLIELIRRERPDLKIILTFFSPSGYEVRKNYQGADIVCYLPFDTPRNVRKFLYLVNPEMAVFVKYEIWRNYLRELSRRNIPTYLISAHFREDQVFFRPSGTWYRSWLRWFTHIFVQDDNSRRLLSGIGISNVTVAGDTRFDRVADIRSAARDIPLLDSFAGKRESESHKGFVMIAGSSWPEDEAVYAPWVKSHDDVRLILAPHEFDPKRLDALKQLFGPSAVLMSEAESDPSVIDNARVFIIDCFGLLSSAYAYADIAYVGGGFGAGIHNLNEAAAFGIPVIYGPNHAKFVEALDLKTLGGGIAVSGKERFAQIADRMLYDSVERLKRGKWAEEYISEKIGATRKIHDMIFSNND